MGVAGWAAGAGAGGIGAAGSGAEGVWAWAVQAMVDTQSTARRRARADIAGGMVLPA